MAKSRKRNNKNNGQGRSSHSNPSEVLSPSSFQPLNMFFNRNGGYEAIPNVRHLKFYFFKKKKKLMLV